MSLSHVKPDEVLPEELDPQELSTVAPPGNTVASPRQYSFSLKNVARAVGIAVLVVILLISIITVVTMAREMSNLAIRIETLDTAFRSGQIGQLTSNVEAMETRLTTLEKQTGELINLPQDVQANASAHALLREQMLQIREFSDGSRKEVVQLLQRVISLENDVKQSALSLEDLNHQLVQKPMNPEQTEATTPAKATSPAKKVNRSAKRAAALDAPFVLTGIERRGGQTFAVVIPHGMSQISAMRLLSPGDGMQGWTLRAIEEDNSALFIVNGSVQRLKVK